MGVYAAKSHPISSSHGRRRRFPEGSSVEVRTNEKGLKDVYFTATVVAPLPPSSAPTSFRKRSRKLIYVEFHDLVTEENGSEKLTEPIDVSFVRPAPPALQEEDESARVFQPEDVVDAFYNDGWWMGVVSRVVEGCERVVVTFQNPPDVREFKVSDVRAHWDWENGIWVKKQSVAFRNSMFGVGKAVEISLDERFHGDAWNWIPASVHQCLGNGKLLVEYDIGEDVIAEVDIQNARPCPLVPFKDEKKFSLFEEVDAYLDHVWMSGMIREELENGGYVVFLKKIKQDREFSRWDLRPHMEWKDGKWLLSSILDAGVLDRKLPLEKSRKRTFDSGTVVENVEVGERSRKRTFDSETVVENVEVGDGEQCRGRRTRSEFDSFVERACNVRLNDPKGAMDEIMEALAKVEQYGFDVGLVHQDKTDKLTKMLDLKVKLEKLVDEANKFRNNVSEHILERGRIEVERQELLEKLSRIESAKEKEDSEIASLQAGLKEIEESIKIVGCDIEGIVSLIL